MSTLKTLKQATLRVLKTTGVTDLAHDSAWRRKRLTILAYHGISLADEHLWNGAQYMHPEVFRGRMEALKTMGCTVLPLGEAVTRLYAGTLPPRAVVITFDDGTADFLKALPILQEYGFPVTLYLTTFYTEYNRPVFDLTVAYLLWKGRDRRLDLAALLGAGPTADLSDPAARLVARDRVFAHALERKLKAEQKDALLAALAARLGIDYAALLEKRIMQNLTVDEVRQVAQSGVDVQLHTHRHRTPHDRALFLREIEDNRASILRMTGKSASHFCYPSGVYDRSFLPWLKEGGVVTGTTCEPGLASRDSDPLLLPRMLDVSGHSVLEFEGMLTGISRLLPRRRTKK
jgi:peptidoglycan/xylan/chitin deacetylase (PgdA/CDA1 family)